MRTRRGPGVALHPKPGRLWTDGHNIFLYHRAKDDAPIVCDFGVEVTRTETTVAHLLKQASAEGPVQR